MCIKLKAHTLLFLSGIFCLTLANSLPANLIMDEVVLVTCQALGHDLYFSCVQKPPLTPDEVSRCVALKTSYLAGLAKLNLPYPLQVASSPDPYAYSPFTPCFFETAHLILFDVCF